MPCHKHWGGTGGARTLRSSSAFTKMRPQLPFCGTPQETPRVFGHRLGLFTGLHQFHSFETEKKVSFFTWPRHLLRRDHWNVPGHRYFSHVLSVARPLSQTRFTQAEEGAETCTFTQFRIFNFKLFRKYHRFLGRDNMTWISTFLVHTAFAHEAVMSVRPKKYSRLGTKLLYYISNRNSMNRDVASSRRQAKYRQRVDIRCLAWPAFLSV